MTLSRIARFGAALLLVAALLPSCTKRVTTASENGRNPWTTPGVLRVGSDEEPDSLNLMYAHTAATDVLSGLLFSFLLRYDRNGNYIPDLATAVPTVRNGGISRDGKTIVVHLRKGVVWADGAPLTAADWLFTYSAVTNPRNNVKTRYGWDAIASATAPDPYTIVIRLKQPNVAALGILAMGGAGYPPMPAHVLAKLPDLNQAPFNSMPLSSGPFVLTAWNRATSLEFEANPRYFRGPPRLKRIVWKIVPDVNTLLSQLTAHEIDVYPQVDAGNVPRLGGISGIVVRKQLLANWRHLDMNASRPLLADARVRRAIAEGVDWALIEKKIYHGLDRLAVSDIYPLSWAAPSIPPYPFDPQEASRLLADAGWTRGTDGVLHKGSLAMHVTISATTGHIENTQSELMVQSLLRPLGIDVTIRNYPANLFFAQNGPLYTGKYDLEWSVDTNGPDPDNAGLWNSAFIPPKGANTTWTSDPVIDATSTAAAATFDQTARKALYQREEARIHEIAPSVFFSWETGYTALNTDVKGYVPAAFIGDTWNAWEWSI